MLRIAYFDCFSGISGDMAIAALLDAGLDFGSLKRGLAKLKVGGYSLRRSRVRRGELAGTKFDCVTKPSGHTHRSLGEIISVINRSRLSSRVKADAIAIFSSIGRAEARVHGISRSSDIHLHELGGIDSIVDIVGVAIACEELRIDRIYSSAVATGRAMIDTMGGRLPVPAPAALELLKGLPLRISEEKTETVTPTGAGILAALSEGSVGMPDMKVEKIGYGAGSRDLLYSPNMLRVIIGSVSRTYGRDRACIIQTNIDDMSPQGFGYLFERLFAAGALDAYVENIYMKKSRPAFKLTVISNISTLERLAAIIFAETTSIGIRFHEVDRLKLDRKTVSVKTRYGAVRVKKSGAASELITASPEYEDCARIARAKHVPFKTIFEEAKRGASDAG
jgi:uncharacterized protein (TIGR00299 family) protein